MKIIVITGSARGIGLGLARSFLDLDCAVIVSGRSRKSVDKAVTELSAAYPAERILGRPCDVTRFEQVQSLWKAARNHFNQVDIWVNNAGLGNSLLPLWEHPPELVRSIIETNVIGAHYGAQVALKGMLAQGFGALYNMEGFGSDGRLMYGMTLYGSSKYALRYITQSLVKETKRTPIIVGAVSPGMVLTDMITSQTDQDAKNRERAKHIINILGDRVETVTPYLAQKMLKNRKTGARFAWLTPTKIFTRFMLARFRKREIWT